MAWDGETLWMGALQGRNVSLYKIDKTTGIATLATTIRRSAIGGLAWDGENLYQATSSALYTVNRTTFQRTLVGVFASSISSNYLALGVRGNALAWDGENLYVCVHSSNQPSLDGLYSIDRRTGVATRVGTVSNYGITRSSPRFEPFGLAWDGNELYAVERDNLYSIDRTTGVATRFGSATRFGVNETTAYGLEWDGEDLYMVGRFGDFLSRSLQAGTVVPATPTNLRASDFIEYTWDLVEGAIEYQIRVRRKGTQVWSDWIDTDTAQGHTLAFQNLEQNLVLEHDDFNVLYPVDVQLRSGNFVGNSEPTDILECPEPVSNIRYASSGHGRETFRIEWDLPSDYGSGSADNVQIRYMISGAFHPSSILTSPSFVASKNYIELYRSAVASGYIISIYVVSDNLVSEGRTFTIIGSEIPSS